MAPFESSSSTPAQRHSKLDPHMMIDKKENVNNNVATMDEVEPA